MNPSTAYFKRTCPYSLKFRIFINEAGLEGRFNIVVFDDGDDTHQQLRQRLEKAGLKPSFPAVELGNDQFRTGSDELIQHYAREAGIDPGQLPLLEYYTRGVFRKLADQ